MTEFTHWSRSSAIGRLLERLDAAARPGSRVVLAVRKDLVRIVKEDNADKLARGVDRYGKPLAKLADSTLKKPRASPLPLMRRGNRSRFLTHFECNLSVNGGRTTVAAGWRDLGGAAANLTGATKPGSKWRLPKRDLRGLTPKGWRKVHERWRQVPGELLRFGGGRS